MKIPAKLFHAAPECVLLQIESEGLRSNWGEIYAAETPGDALTFMWFRLLDHVHPENYLTVGDQKVPALVAHDAVHVWEIDTTKTDASLWSPGTDHSASFFGNATSWASRKTAQHFPNDERTKMIDYVESLLGVRLTRRGRVVVGLILFAIFLAVFAFLNDITTPEQCKVPLEEMSTFCKNLLYP